MKKIFLIIGFSLFLVACNSEENAREIYNQALTEKRDGNLTEAIDLYKTLIADYPSSSASVDANKELEKMEFLEKVTVENTRQALKNMLDMYRLDNGKYPETELGLMGLPDILEIPSYRISQFKYTKVERKYTLTHKNDK